MQKIIECKAKAFSGEKVKMNRFLVSDNTVRVWDNVAGYFTRVHAMSAKAQKRIIDLSNT